MRPLPCDVWQLIHDHAAALALQGAWRRRSRFGHARSRAWPVVRAHLGQASHAHLVRYAGVRREWRSELGSWVGIAKHTLATICEEADEGLWGPCWGLSGRD